MPRPSAKAAPSRMRKVKDDPPSSKPKPPSQPRRPRRFPPAASSSNRRRPREQMNNISPARAQYSNNDNGTISQNHSSSHQQNYYQQSHNDPNTNTSYNGNGRGSQQILQRRGSYSFTKRGEGEDIPIQMEQHYRHTKYKIDDAVVDISTTRRRSHHSTNTKMATSSTNRLLRIFTLIIVCMLMFWGYSWGIEMGTGLVRGVINIIFGRSHQESSSEYQLENESIYRKSDALPTEAEDSEQSLQSNAGLRDLRGSSSNAENENISSQTDSGEPLSAHDLNLKSHLLKAEGRQIINDRPMEVDEEGKGDKAYMGEDSTNDFFFAGRILEKKRIVNAKGRIETVSLPAHSYAVLPVLVDSNPFAISLWINLSPSLEDNGKEDGIHEDSRGPRVILSTTSEDYQGCHSDVFVMRPATGIVLYAQPQEGEEGVKTYRIILEYPRTDKKLCRTLIGSNQNSLLVQEGEWHHIALFATQMSGEGDERISLYVDGDLAGRNVHESRQYYSYNSKSTTTIGRFATQYGSEIDISESFDLGGRVGMLAFWETGAQATLTAASKRMNIQSESDEDHVTRAMFRVSFDVRAIEEMSLQGLTVKEPTLLYSFDGQKEIKATHDFYADHTELPSLINELMSGRNGTVVVELIDGMPV